MSLLCRYRFAGFGRSPVRLRQPSFALRLVRRTKRQLLQEKYEQERDDEDQRTGQEHRRKRVAQRIADAVDHLSEELFGFHAAGWLRSFRRAACSSAFAGWQKTAYSGPASDQFAEIRSARRLESFLQVFGQAIGHDGTHDRDADRTPEVTEQLRGSRHDAKLFMRNGVLGGQRENRRCQGPNLRRK